MLRKTSAIRWDARCLDVLEEGPHERVGRITVQSAEGIDGGFRLDAERDALRFVEGFLAAVLSFLCF